MPPVGCTRKAFEILRRHAWTESGIAEALNSLGIIARKKKDFAKARHLHEESLEIKKKLGNKEGIADSLANLGGVTADAGDLVEGMRSLR